MVVRASLKTVSTAVERYYVMGYRPIPAGEDLDYVPALVNTFDVEEYIKGSGGDEIVALALGQWEETESAATGRLAELLAGRPTWADDREAVLFLNKNPKVPSTVNQSDRYLAGYVEHRPGEDGYTVASRHVRAWLPDAEAPGASGGATTQRAATVQRFLLAEPRSTSTASRSASGGTSTQPDPPTITLGALKSKAIAIVAEIVAGDGSEAYEKCVKAKYYVDRRSRTRVSESGRFEPAYEMGSGLATGYVLHSDYRAFGLPPDITGRYWTEGPDGDLFTVETYDPRPIRAYVPPSAPPDHTQYGRRTVTVRPLPAGEYRYRSLGIPASRLICNLMGDFERQNIGAHATVTVTAPSGVTHEAFFDPADLSPGVGANSSSGVLKPSTFGSNSLERIEWASGTLKVNLTGSHAGQHLDFLDQDGELVESVAVDDAVSSGGLLTWSVPAQPWESDDKLMARLYRKTMELCAPREHFAKPGACYQDPVFAGAPFSFTVAEDIAVGSAVGTVAVSHPEMATTTLAIISGDDNGHFAISDEGAITTAHQLDRETTPSYTLTVQADAGRWSRATAEVTVTVTPVTVTLSPREEQYFTGTDMTIEWSDPDGCDNRYFVGVYNNEELYRVERILGFHPAPATTTLSADLNLSWDRVPSHDWWVGVHCAPDDGSEWRVVGKASLQWGLPSATEPPAITIADLGATLANGQSDGFTVSASNLDATASYTIRVTTDDADLGFDSGCTDRQEEVTVTAESASHTAALTLHGCATPGGTVTATLLSGGATIDTATQDVTVVPSTDATLRSLALSGVALTFDPAVTGYTAAVANTVTETTVTPTANDDGATSVVKLGGVADADGTVPLSVGGNVITIEVTAEDGNTARTYTITVTRAAAAAAPPGTPDRPSGERTGPGAVSLDWNDVPTATSYDVMFWLVAVNGFVQLSPDNAVHSISITFNGSGATVAGLSTTGHDGWYAFVVRAVNDAGASGWSGNNRIPVPPDTPDRPSGQRTGAGAVSLDWNDVPTATSYVVEFWRDGAYVQLSADAAVHGVSITFDGSSAAVTGLPTVGYQWYFFRVRAVNAGGASGWSPNNAIAVSS